MKLLYATMRHLCEAVGGSGTFLVSATRLGGHHGYDAAGANAPMGGAVTGFTKAYKRERPDALVKAVDFADGASPRPSPTCSSTRPCATRVRRGRPRRRPALDRGAPRGSLRPTPAGIELGPDTVFVVTGAAGSIVSAITADLARASRGTFHLLDLVPAARPGRPGHRRLRLRQGRTSSGRSSSG